MAGDDLENRYVLIDKKSGKILSVGKSIDEADGMEIIDADGRSAHKDRSEGTRDRC